VIQKPKEVMDDSLVHKNPSMGIILSRYFLIYIGKGRFEERKNIQRPVDPSSNLLKALEGPVYMFLGRRHMAENQNFFLEFLESHLGHGKSHQIGVDFKADDCQCCTKILLGVIMRKTNLIPELK
jgi:hypothetical protein